ncbi:hypothetical protein CEXT_381621 [Caerostris extrusa]|uniref:Uncharacterized protein n=1 Tax=Caerostris extrusa TaxID=172846 RepID=A0AAV4WGZ3_CAEEX|nr:hypothetical protein CEXT_381621 [Caerostris extrusa]
MRIRELIGKYHSWNHRSGRHNWRSDLNEKNGPAQSLQNLRCGLFASEKRSLARTGAFPNFFSRKSEEWEEEFLLPLLLYSSSQKRQPKTKENRSPRVYVSFFALLLLLFLPFFPVEEIKLNAPLFFFLGEFSREGKFIPGGFRECLEGMRYSGFG